MTQTPAFVEDADLMPSRFTPSLEDIGNALEAAVRSNASDIVIKHNVVPKVKVHGVWEDLTDLAAPTIAEMEDLARLMLTAEQYQQFKDDCDYDFQFATDNYRFRVNAAYQRAGIMLTFRPIPKEPPRLESLGFIDDDVIVGRLQQMVSRPRGLVLVTGPTGMGKSTTLAAMIRYINENFARNVITIEDPIEFTHEGVKSLISQREVGSDTRSFSKALRGALRQTPDIILVGELRDPETIEAALTAAETGHLVLGTLHTNTAPSAITRILDVVPGDKVNLIKAQLSAALIAVVTQQLVSRSDRPGKQAILEIMYNEGVITQLIRDGENALDKYYDEMFKNDSPSVLMDAQLAQAARLGVLEYQVAQARAVQSSRFNQIYNKTRVEATPKFEADPAAKGETGAGGRTGVTWGKKSLS